MLRRLALLLTAATLVAPGASAQALPDALRGPRCGAPEPSASHRALLHAAAGAADRDGGGIIQIPVAFHVVSVGGTPSQGAVSEPRLDAQMNALNAVFFPLGYRLVRVVTERVEAPAWWDLERESAEELAMKEALGRDPTRYLNIYSTRIADDLLGWAYLPGTFSSDPATDEADLRHGLVIDPRSMPGGTFDGYDAGDTAIHELGHFLGLLHTYHGWTPADPTGGCSVGDGVDDTPAEGSPNLSGCPETRDTCPALPGLDPVRNFMDASPDACLDRFSPGQADRMAALFETFKPSLADGAEVFVPERELAFGSVAVGGEAALSARIVSLRGPLLPSVQLSTAGPGFAVDLTTVTVQAGETVEVPVTFAPEAVGEASGALVIETGNADLGTLTVPLSGAGVLAPSVDVTPPAVTATVPAGGGEIVPIVIANTGPGTLSYVLDTAGERGPTDTFGYSWIDSDAVGGPVYDWVPLTVAGGAQELTLGDDDSALVQLPFQMPWYGTPYDEVHIVSNGYLSFPGPATAFDNTAIPAAGAPNGIAAPYWDDLTFGAGSRVLAQDLGGGRFAVQWTAMQAYDSPGSATFQAILHADGDVVFQYQSVDFDTPGATIGIEDADGAVGLQVARDVEYARAGLAVRFTTSAWIEGAAPAVGSVPSGDERTVLVTLNAAGLAEGVYQRLVTLSTNDPHAAALRLPAVLAVGDVPRPPAPTAPRYDADGLPVALTLEWLAVPGATEYRVEVARDLAFTDVVLAVSQGATALAFSAEGAQTYAWRARARVDGRLSDWSIPFLFTTAEPVTSAPAPARTRLSLGAPFPNPVAESVSLPLTLARAGRVVAEVYDVTGRRVATLAEGPLPAGAHALDWSVGSVPAGVYIVRVRAADKAMSARVVVLPRP